MRRDLAQLTAAEVPASVRRGAHERLLRMDADAERFEDALGHARELVRGSAGSVDGFEPLWRLAWSRYAAGDYAEARDNVIPVTRQTLSIAWKVKFPQPMPIHLKMPA